MHTIVAEVVDGECVGACRLSVSTRGQNLFPHVLLQRSHISPHQCLRPAVEESATVQETAGQFGLDLQQPGGSIDEVGW
jgi:hypothetical protein